MALLLADAVGLGKTIQAGMVLRELMLRRRIRRVVVLCPASLRTQWRDEMQEKSVALAGFVGALCYGASIALYITAAQHMGATRAQMIFASAPFFGVALAAVALGEPLSAGQLVAGVLLVGSLALLFRDEHAHDHAHDELSHTHMHRHDDGHHNHMHPGLPAWTRHSHEHEALEHAHPHWPDLHHRHDHA